jgi:hypothetical protein
MPQQVIVDTRLPISTAAPNDPANPRNLIRNLIAVQAQANADTKYDIIPPPRVEGFADSSRTMFWLACTVAIVAIVVAIYARVFYVKLVFAVLAIYALHYAAGKLENRAV